MLRDYFQQKLQKKINRRLRRGYFANTLPPLTPNITKLTIVFVSFSSYPMLRSAWLRIVTILYLLYIYIYNILYI